MTETQHVVAQVYSATSLGFLENLDGLYVADRTRGTATEGPRWVPSPQNVRYIPPAEEITDASPDKWALYPGSWGAGNLFLDGKRRLVCYRDNFTATGATPSPRSHALQQSCHTPTARNDHYNFPA